MSDFHQVGLVYRLFKYDVLMFVRCDFVTMKQITRMYCMLWNSLMVIYVALRYREQLSDATY